MANKGFSTTALAGPFGIAVEGLDITAASTDQFDALVNLLYQHHILVIRGQDLSPADYIAFGRKWGELVPYFQKRWRSEEHTSELQSLMRNSYAVFCLKKKKKNHLIISQRSLHHNDIIKEQLC